MYTFVQYYEEIKYGALVSVNIRTSCGILVYSLVLSIATEFTSKSFIIRTIMFAIKVTYRSTRNFIHSI